MVSLRTMIVDDEPIARARLRALCLSMADRVVVVGEAADGQTALERIEAIKPELVLLDIAMPDLDGMEVARSLRAADPHPAIVFCTAFPNHALEAFEVSAIDYLLKPVSRDRLAEAVTKASQFRGNMGTRLHSSGWLDHLWVPHRDAMVRLDIGDLQRVEAEGDYVRLVTTQASYLLHETMARLESRLDPADFVRLRRSVIVRAELMQTAIHQGGGVWNVVLDDGTTVRAGPNYWKAVKDRLRSRDHID